MHIAAPDNTAATATMYRCRPICAALRALNNDTALAPQADQSSATVIAAIVLMARICSCTVTVDIRDELLVLCAKHWTDRYITNR